MATTDSRSTAQRKKDHEAAEGTSSVPSPTTISEPLPPNVPYTVEDADGIERIISPPTVAWTPAPVEPDPAEVERLEELEKKSEERKEARLKSPAERDEEALKEAEKQQKEEAKVAKEQRKEAAKAEGSTTTTTTTKKTTAPAKATAATPATPASSSSSSAGASSSRTS